jgi:hypothetical protein
MSTHSHAFRPIQWPALSSLVAPLAHAGRQLWDFLAIAGERRAQNELRRLANSYAISQPELAARLREAARHPGR